MATSTTSLPQLYASQVHPPLWRLLSSSGEADALAHDLERAVIVAVLDTMGLTSTPPLAEAGATFAAALAARVGQVTDDMFASFHGGEKKVGDWALEKLLTAIWSEVLGFLALPVALRPGGGSETATAAAAPELPTGVQRAVMAVASAIFSLTGVSLAPDEAHPPTAPAPEREPAAGGALRHSVQQLWFAAALLFLQQLSARNDDTSAWKAFAAACASADAKKPRPTDPLAISGSDDDNDNANHNGGGGLNTQTAREPLPHPSGCAAALSVRSDSAFRAAVERAARGGWAEALAPALLAETVDRTRFRRAALLFKSYTPHTVSQAPGAAYLLYDVLDSFHRAWVEAMATTVPAGSLSIAAQRYFSGVDDRDGELLEAVTADAEVAPLRALVEAHGDRLALVLAQSRAHGFLLATVVGAFLSARYLIPDGGKSGGSAAGSRPSTSTTAGPSTATTAPAPPPPTRVGGRGFHANATGGGGLPTATTVDAAARTGAAAAAATVAGGLPSVTTPVLPSARDTRAGSLAHAEAAHRWLPRWDPYAHPGMDGEWVLRHFSPMGALMRHVGILSFLQPHLFQWSTQVRIGLTPPQHTQARERFAVCCLLSGGLARVPVAHAMFHYASEPELAAAPTDITGEASEEEQRATAPSLPGAALAAFTQAMNAYAARADAVMVVDVAGASGGVGLLDEPRRRRKRGGRDGDGAGSDATAAAAEAAMRRESGVGRLRDGELRGARFSAMEYAEVLPTWQQFLSEAAKAVGGGAHPFAPQSLLLASPAAAATISPMLSSPCRLVMSLLAAHYPTAAARVLSYFLHEAGLNVFLVPRGGGPAAHAPAGRWETAAPAMNIQSYLTRALLARQEEEELEGCPGREADSLTAPCAPAKQDAVRGLYTHLSCLLPVLRLMGTYAASQDFLVCLVRQLIRLCTHALDATADDAHTSTAAEAPAAGSASHSAASPPRESPALFARRCLTLAELSLIYVVMPGLRVLSASPVLYSAIDALFGCFRRAHASPSVDYGANEAEYLHYPAWVSYLLPGSPLAQPPRFAETLGMAADGADERPRGAELDPFDLTAVSKAGRDGDVGPIRQLLTASAVRGARTFPHDTVRCREQEALLNQTLKRVNEHNVDYYRSLLRQVLYAEPLHVVDRLLAQAVGYDNSFLALHTRLLQGLPDPIIVLAVHHGLTMLRRYAAEERVGDGGVSATRVARVATFLATMWRHHTRACRAGRDDVVGPPLLRAAESALRRDTRQGMVMGLELLKAILLQLAHHKLEHEEHFSETQQKAIATPTEAVRFFGRGSMESFRMTRWGPWLTPADIAIATAALRTALAAPCTVPLDVDPAEGAGEAQPSAQPDSPQHPHALEGLTTGQCLLLHLCRLHAKIYHLQADLDGPMELVLLTSAKDYSTLNDLILGLEELLPVGPPENQLARVAMTHVALQLTARFRRKAAAGGGGVACAAPAPLPTPLGDINNEGEETGTELVAAHGIRPVSYPLLRLLSAMTAANLTFDDAAYDAALAEWRECAARADPHGRLLLTTTGGPTVGGMAGVKRAREEQGGAAAGAAGAATATRTATGAGLAQPGPAAFAARRRELAGTDLATATWLREQRQRIEEGRAAHAALTRDSDAARRRLLDGIFQEVFGLATSSKEGPQQQQQQPQQSTAETITEFVVDYLLPRALLSLEDTLFVEGLISWLLRETVQASREVARQRVTDLALTLVSAGVTLFAGLTDGEAKRFGHLVAHILRRLGMGQSTTPVLGAALAECVAAMQKAKAAAAEAEAAGAVGGVHSEDSTRAGGGAGAALVTAPGVVCTAEQFEAYVKPPCRPLTSLLLAPTAKAVSAAATVQGAAAAAAAEAEAAAAGVTTATPAAPTTSPLTAKAYTLQLEAYLCRFLVQFLGNLHDNPPHLHRNALLILERLDKKTFPTTLCATELLIRVVALHADRKNPNYASATALVRTLRDNYQAKRAVLQPVTEIMSSVAAAASATTTVGDTRSATVVAEAKAWYGLWRVRETYMEQQLLRDEMLQFVGRQRFEELDEEMERAEAEAEAEAEDGHGVEAGSDGGDDGDGDGESVSEDSCKNGSGQDSEAPLLKDASSEHEREDSHSDDDLAEEEEAGNDEASADSGSSHTDSSADEEGDAGEEPRH